MMVYFEAIRNSLGQVDSVVRRPDGASVLFDFQTKTFDELDNLTKQLRDWEIENGELDLSDIPPLPPPLELVRQQAIDRITQETIYRQEALVAGYASAERDTWDMKIAQAKLFLETNDFDKADILESEAIAFTGISDRKKLELVMNGLATKILTKASALPKASAALSGKRNKLIALISKSENINFIESLTLDAEI